LINTGSMLDCMDSITTYTTYFDSQGSANTDEALRLAKQRADELGIKNIVVASSTGETGVKASRLFKGYNLVIVTSVAGYSNPDEIRLKPENRDEIVMNGGKIVMAAHAFGSIGRSIHSRFNTIQVDEVIANVLRLFSEGVKVALEIALMSVDAGHMRTGEETIAIAGGGSGADTAIVIQPSNTHTFFNLRVKEIICKPR
jgi:hypothetical protein